METSPSPASTITASSGKPRKNVENLFPIEEERMASQKGGHAMIDDVIFPFPTRRESGENSILPLFKMDTPQGKALALIELTMRIESILVYCHIFGFDRKYTVFQQHIARCDLNEIF